MINLNLPMPTHRQPRRSLLLRNVLLAVVVISIILSANSLCYGMPTPDEESFSREVSAKERLLPVVAKEDVPLNVAT